MNFADCLTPIAQPLRGALAQQTDIVQWLCFGS